MIVRRPMRCADRAGRGWRGLALSVVIAIVAPCVQAAEPLTKFGVLLLQPGPVLEERVPNVDSLAEYIRSVEAASREAVLANPSKRSVSGFIVVAIRPGQKSKVWLDFDSSLGFDASRQMIAKISAVKPFEAKKGPVVFALKVALWDGFESPRVAPSPTDWKAATRSAGRQLEIDELVDRVWP